MYISLSQKKEERIYELYILNTDSGFNCTFTPNPSLIPRFHSDHFLDLNRDCQSMDSLTASQNHVPYDTTKLWAQWGLAHDSPEKMAMPCVPCVLWRMSFPWLVLAWKKHSTSIRADRGRTLGATVSFNTHLCSGLSVEEDQLTTWTKSAARPQRTETLGLSHARDSTKPQWGKTGVTSAYHLRCSVCVLRVCAYYFYQLTK